MRYAEGGNYAESRIASSYQCGTDVPKHACLRMSHGVIRAGKCAVAGSCKGLPGTCDGDARVIGGSQCSRKVKDHELAMAECQRCNSLWLMLFRPDAQMVVDRGHSDEHPSFPLGRLVFPVTRRTWQAASLELFVGMVFGYDPKHVGDSTEV